MRMILALVAFALVVGIIGAQDFIKGTQAGGPVELSGLSPDVFDGMFFQSDGWTFDMTSYSMTPSQAAFLKGDDSKDGAPFGNRTVLRCGRGPA